MKKIHVLVVALTLATAAVFGVLAATRTVGLGGTHSSAAPVTTTSIAARAHRLDRVQASLKRALRNRPPALPPVPVVRRRPAAVATAPRIVYQRPAPIVVVKHRAGGDDSEHESEGGESDD
jgi:hypothetical protein